MKNYLSPENLNLETSQNLKDLIKASSEMDGCPIKNILNNETNSMWLSGEGMPQEIIINLKRGILKEFPKKLSAVAIYCWHAYPTNPKLIEIQISKNNENKFNSLGNFELCLKPGIQLFQLDDDSEFLINEKIQKIILKIIIKETFNGDRTYINNVYLYENIDMNYINANNISEDNVNLGNNNNNNNGLSDSSSIIYLRESREKNLPRSNFSTIGKDKLNNQLKDNLNTFSKDLTEDLLDLKSKDLGLISINNLNSNPTINLNSINLNNNLTSENNMLISDSELSERKSINRDRNLFNNDLNVSSKILEEEEEKEKSSIFNSVKKSNTTSKIFNPLKTQNSNLKNNIILTSTNNFQTEIQKEIYKNNEDPINEYIQNDNLDNYNNNLIFTLQNDFRTYQKYTEEKFKNYDDKISNIENELYEIKEKISKLAENLSTFVDAQNSQNQTIYGYILEECKHMIDSQIVKAINNLGKISNLNSIGNNNNFNNNNFNNNNFNNNNFNNNESYYKENESYMSSHLVNNNDDNNLNNLNQIPTEENHNINNFINISGINSNNRNISNIDASKVSEFESKLDFQLEEKFANFSNRLGKKISETILKPSIEKLENMMKGNLNEVKNSLKNVEKRQKQNLNNSKKSQNRKENISKLLEKLQEQVPDENTYKDFHRKNKINSNNNINTNNNNKEKDIEPKSYK